MLALLLAMTSVLGIIATPNQARAAIGSITEFSIPAPFQAGFFPRQLAIGSDDQVWHTGFQRVSKSTTTGSFTQYFRSTGGYVYGVAAGADGNMWIGESSSVSGEQIVKMATNGTVLATYPTPSGKVATQMTLGPDGAVWFVYGNSPYIGKIATDGTITQYSGGYTVTDIAAGPDGNLWFTYGKTGSTVGNGVGKITTTGTTTLYPVAVNNAWPQAITVGSDGNLWFTIKNINKIGKITITGVITQYSLPTANSLPYAITSGSDGALWFTANGTSKIGRMSTAGVVTNEFSVPTLSSSLEDIITGANGLVWYADYASSKIGKVATALYGQTVSFTSSAPSSAVIDGPTYTPAATATSGLPVAITVDSSSAGVCSIVSGVVSFQGEGTCTLNANQGGDADYSPAAQVQQSLTVAPVNVDTSVALNCPTAALIGSSVTCTITITNGGPAAAENVSLNALFSSSLGSIVLSGGGVLSGQAIAWSTPSLAPSASITLTFDATATLASRASISAALLQTNPDSDISNNIADAKILIH